MLILSCLLDDDIVFGAACQMSLTGQPEETSPLLSGSRRIADYSVSRKGSMTIT